MLSFFSLFSLFFLCPGPLLPPRLPPLSPLLSFLSLLSLSTITNWRCGWCVCVELLLSTSPFCNDYCRYYLLAVYLFSSRSSFISCLFIRKEKLSRLLIHKRLNLSSGFVIDSLGLNISTRSAVACTDWWNLCVFSTEGIGIAQEENRNFDFWVKEF